MHTREELMAGLLRAVEILRRMEGLQAEVQNMKIVITLSGLRPRRRLMKHIGIGRTILIWLFTAYMISMPFNIYIPFIGGSISYLVKVLFFLWLGETGMQLAELPLVLLELAIAYPVMKFICIFLNRKIESKNKKIENREERSKEKLIAKLEKKEQLLQQLEMVQAEYAREVAPWYSDEYSNSAAAAYMLKVVQNGRADTLKEAYNLYETDKHRKNVEQNQQQMLRQQRMQTVMLARSIDSLRKEVAADRAFVYDQNHHAYTFKKVSR